MRFEFGITAAGVSLLCAACASTAPPAPPAPPAAFEHAPAGTVERWPAQDWWRGFASQELDDLLTQAATDNLEIAAGIARVRQADAHARVAGAAILPQVDLTANANRIAGRAQGVSGSETDWSVLLSASYEVDFWGRNRAAAQSARLSAAASRDALAVIGITVQNGVANTYFQILALRERQDLAQLNLEAAKSTLGYVAARYDAGAASATELAAQRTAVANAELALPQLRQQETEALGALALLLGRQPEGFDVAARRLGAVSEPAVAPGIPSELLRRRPDLAAAESRLLASHADLAAARAALFPSLSLTLSGGVQNPGVQAVFLTLAGAGPSINVGAGLLQTIFDNGRRRGVVAETAAQEQELLADYRAAILAALLDVETALSALQHLDLQRRAQQEAVEQSQRAAEIALLRYREGSGQYLAVIEAQRSAYAAREQFSQFKLARLQALTSLAKALGGGWQVASTTAGKSS